MDWDALANMLAGAMTLKAIEAIGSSAGKTIYNTLYSKAQASINAIRGRFSGRQDHKSLQILSQFEKDPTKTQQELVKALQEAASDAAFVREIKRTAQETRNTLLDCLEQGFTSGDLDKLAMRLGFGPGALFSANATNPQKAMALLDAVEKQRRYPELVKQMLEINPYLA